MWKLPLRICLIPVLLSGVSAVSADKVLLEQNPIFRMGQRKRSQADLDEGRGIVHFDQRILQVVIQNRFTMAAINGVNVWLCKPITLKYGQVYISSLDLNTSIEPILFPKTNEARARIQTICLDPGHGHQDTGGIFGRYVEKRYTLPLAEELAGQLEAAGFKVILTRTNDTFVELEDRPALANRQKSDLFISLHFNIGPPGEAKGVEVYCLTPASEFHKCWQMGRC